MCLTKNVDIFLENQHQLQLFLDFNYCAIPTLYAYRYKYICKVDQRMPQESPKVANADESTIPSKFNAIFGPSPKIFSLSWDVQFHRFQRYIIFNEMQIRAFVLTLYFHRDFQVIIAVIRGISVTVVGLRQGLRFYSTPLIPLRKPTTTPLPP